MSETTMKKTGSTRSRFSLNGLLVGYLVFGLLIICGAIFVFSIQSVQSSVRSSLGITRGQVIFLGFVIGLVLTTPFALYFEKQSRD